MAYYKCKIIDSVGQRKIATYEANDKHSLKARLKNEKIVLLKAELIQEKEVNTFFAVSSKVKSNETITFYRQFAVMIKASIPISNALNVLRNQRFTKAFKKVLNQLYQDVQTGVLLSDAFAKHKKVFPDFFVKMVAIGENTGSLDRVLESMADYYENDRKIKRKAKAAMIYPSILMVLIIIVTVFITMFILPRFEKTIQELGGEVPLITVIMMNISKFMQQNFIFIFVGLAAIIILLVFFVKKTKKGKYCYDAVKLHLPFIGKIEKNLITSRFAKAFIILLGSGMNMLDCLLNLQKMLDNQIFAEKFTYTIEEVKRGKRIAQSMENIKIFPPMLTEMIHVGEQSGNIEEVLNATSKYFDECVEESIAKATAALEPIMIIFLGIIVAVVILAVLLPIIALMNSI